jgi:hypothetical protein
LSLVTGSSRCHIGDKLIVGRKQGNLASQLVLAVVSSTLPVKWPSGWEKHRCTAERGAQL